MQIAVGELGLGNQIECGEQCDMVSRVVQVTILEYDLDIPDRKSVV